jgi:hypothetical protein
LELGFELKAWCLESRSSTAWHTFPVQNLIPTL